MVKFVKFIGHLATGACTAVVAITVGLGTPAKAELLTYYLQGTLEDGGSFEGTVSYDSLSPDLAPNALAGAGFALESWNMQLFSPTQGSFSWMGPTSSSDLDAFLVQADLEITDGVGFGFGLNEDIVNQPEIDLDELFDFAFAFEYLGSDLNVAATPNEIGAFVGGALFQPEQVPVTTAQIRQIGVPEPSSTVGLLVFGCLGMGFAFLRKKKSKEE